MSAPCIHPRCPHPACDGYLCAGHASRRRPAVRVTRTPTVQAAYAMAWADHDPTDPTALRDRLRAAQADADRLAVEHRDAIALHAAKLREYAASPRLSPEADRAWREAQRASDAAQMAARMMRGAT